jgi:hypothetical protein
MQRNLKMQRHLKVLGLSSGRTKLALLFFVAIVAALVLSFFSSAAPNSDAQVGYGAPQNIPDQTIKPISHGSSNTGLAVGVGAAVVIIGGATFFGWRHAHAADQPYD